MAVAIGPELGTVGPELIRNAAKEAVRIADLLVVCGFAFDPLTEEEAATLGRLTILQASMNPDLAMGAQLLKKTASGNLFTVFGEPDMELKPTDDGRPTLEIHGLDVYDPTTGRFAHRRSTTSLPGSSIPITTATPSSSAAPASPVPTIPTTNSAAP